MAQKNTEKAKPADKPEDKPANPTGDEGSLNGPETGIQMNKHMETAEEQSAKAGLPVGVDVLGPENVNGPETGIQMNKHVESPDEQKKQDGAPPPVDVNRPAPLAEAQGAHEEVGPPYKPAETAEQLAALAEAEAQAETKRRNNRAHNDETLRKFKESAQKEGEWETVDGAKGHKTEALVVRGRGALVLVGGSAPIWLPGVVVRTNDDGKKILANEGA